MEGSQRGGGQFRRANIVYFLSRNGTVEQPHLIRVHHLHNNGVYLRDVKRWLGELRGKNMPDSFGWAYKRKYKNGYVWQDLKDDDLITPISDNEYVLKGSFFGDEIDKTVLKTATKGTAKVTTEEQVISESSSESIEREDNCKVLPEPQLKCRADDSDRRMALLKVNGSTKRREDEQQKFRRSYSSRASHVFRNILSCRLADANESALRPTGLAAGSSAHRRSRSDLPGQQPQPHQQGSEGVDGSRKSRSGGRKSAGTASYKPSGAPSCSQCGKQFDPEKLHSHMQSCKALRGRAKGRTSFDSVPLRRESRSEDDFSRDSISGYLA